MGIGGGSNVFGSGRRIFVYENNLNGNMEYSDELAVSSSDSVFGFLEGSVESLTSNEEGCYGYQEEFNEEDGDEEGENSLDESKSFWEKQHNLLQATICRTTSLETGIRNVTRESLKELQSQGHYCNCGKTISGNNCKSCLMKEVSSKLRIAGYNTAVCRTKWANSPQIPKGEHTFIDVVDNSNSKKGEVRVIIELSFRADFEMARASDDYNQLINRLPEVFVGKAERLKALIKILCEAAKKCMKDKKMHIGPWRKQKYMQAKWFTINCERIQQSNSPINRTNSNQISKSGRGASMLTRALMDMPMKAVAVV